MLYGAVIGDVLGSTFEFNNWLKSPEELPIFPPDAHPTDDSVLTCAVADALIASAVRDDVSENTLRVDPVQFQRKVRGALRDWGCTFPKAGYGSRFMRWMLSRHRSTYRESRQRLRHARIRMCMGSRIALRSA